MINLFYFFSTIEGVRKSSVNECHDDTPIPDASDCNDPSTLTFNMSLSVKNGDGEEIASISANQLEPMLYTDGEYFISK